MVAKHSEATHHVLFHFRNFHCRLFHPPKYELLNIEMESERQLSFTSVRVMHARNIGLCTNQILSNRLTPSVFLSHTTDTIECCSIWPREVDFACMGKRQKQWVPWPNFGRRSSASTGGPVVHIFNLPSKWPSFHWPATLRPSGQVCVPRPRESERRWKRARIRREIAYHTIPI